MYRALRLLRDFHTLPWPEFQLRHREVPTEERRARAYMLSLAGVALEKGRPAAEGQPG
jgi:hypothetical protein